MNTNTFELAYLGETLRGTVKKKGDVFVAKLESHTAENVQAMVAIGMVVAKLQGVQLEAGERPRG